MKKFRGLGIFITILMLIWSCSDNNNSTGSDDTTPTFPQPVQFTAPDDSPAEVQGHILSFNGFVNTYSGFLILAQNSNATKEGNTWVWTTTVQQLTVRVTAERLSNGNIEWKVILNGTQGQVQYDNWVAFEGQSSPDGQSGSGVIYMTNSQEVAANIEWSVDENGNKEATMVTDEGTIVLTNNADGSGSLQRYENDILVYEAQWDTEGNGNWTAYDSQGNIIDEGTW